MMPPITRHNERQGDQGGRPMFNMQASKLNRIAALGAGIMIALSGSALASPLPIFPFILTAPVQSGPPQQAAPPEDDGRVAEMPARWKRHTISYATREAPGTIIIVRRTRICIMCSAVVRRSDMVSALAATASPGRACSQ